MDAIVILQIIDKLIEKCSNKECVAILKKVISECQQWVDGCEEEVSANS